VTRRILVLALSLCAAVARGQGAADGEQEIPDDVVRKVDPSVVAIQHERAVGSGFVVSPDGYILTNGHVVQGNDEEDPTQPAKVITVILFNEQKYPARVIGFSMDPDVALIKIEPGRPLQAVELADSRAAQIGQRCFAVGTPVGLKRTFTGGILSNVDRTDLGTETKVFQTDAAINPGNSGGPLFDRHGRVLGINTYASRGSNNLGFTIPIHVASVLQEHFLAHGRFVRAIVPLFFVSELYDELAQTLGADRGLLVTSVMAGTAAYEAGLREGDIIVEVDGRPCSARTRAEALDFDWDLSTRTPGTDIEFTVMRGSGPVRERSVIRARLEAMEPLPKMGRHAGELPELRYEALGLGVQRMVLLHRVILGLSEIQGVLVTTVRSTGPAAKAGLREGDVLTRVGDRATPGIDEFRRELESRLAEQAKLIEIQIARGRLSIPTAIAPYYALRGRKFALIVPPKDPEYIELLKRELEAGGAKVVLAGLSGDAVETNAGRIPLDARMADLRGGDFDTILFAGGAGGRALWGEPDALRLVREACEANRIVAALGPSVMVLVQADGKLLEKKITISKEDSAEAIRRKANYTGSTVESDGRIVTGTGFDREAVREFLKVLYRVERNLEP
jgi:serine protease Do